MTTKYRLIKYDGEDVLLEDVLKNKFPDSVELTEELITHMAYDFKYKPTSILNCDMCELFVNEVEKIINV